MSKIAFLNLKVFYTVFLQARKIIDDLSIVIVILLIVVIDVVFDETYTEVSFKHSPQHECCLSNIEYCNHVPLSVIGHLKLQCGIVRDCKQFSA